MTDEEIKAKAREIYAENGFQTARTLRDGFNLDAKKIARGLRDGCGISNMVTAWALLFEDGLNLSVTELAHVLYSPDGLDLDAKEITRMLFDFGCDASETAKALYSPEGCGLSAASTAKAINWVIFSFSGIAKALRDGCGISNGEIALAIKEGCGYDFDHLEHGYVIDEFGTHCNICDAVVAKALQDGLDLTLAETVKALQDGMNLSAEDVAKALRDGLNLSAAEIAKTLRDGLNLDPARASRALKEGLDLTFAETANALRDGLDLNAAEVAKAFRNGLYLTAEEVAEVLRVVDPNQNANEGISEIYKADTETIVEHRGDMCVIRGVGGGGFISAGSFKGKRLRIEDCTVHFQKIEADEIMLDGTLEAGSVTADFVSCDVESTFRAKTLNGDVKLFATAEAMIGTLNGNASFARHPGCVCELKVGTHNGRVRNQGEMEFASMTVNPAIHDEIKARALGVTPIAGQNQLTEIRNTSGGKYSISSDRWGLKIESSEMTPVNFEFGQIGTDVNFGGMVNVVAGNVLGNLGTFEHAVVQYPMTIAVQQVNGSVFFSGNEFHAVEIKEDLHLYSGTADVTSIEESAYVFHHSKAEIGQIGKNLEVTGNADVAVGCVSGSARVIDNGQLKAEKIARRCSVSDDATVKVDWAGSVDAAGNSTVEVGLCPSLALSKDNANLKATYAERCSQLGQSVLSADNWIDFYMGKRTSPGVDGVIKEKKGAGAGKGGIR